MAYFFKESEKQQKKQSANLIDKVKNIDADTARNIRIGLNIFTGFATAGLFHLAYYAFMFINWFVGQCTGVRAAKTLEWDPFANIKYLNPDAHTPAAYSF